jgi:hypothetical protein
MAEKKAVKTAEKTGQDDASEARAVEKRPRRISDSKKRRFFVKICIAIILIILLGSIALKLSFSVQDELIVKTRPGSISIQTTNLGSFPISIETKVQKFFLCSTECAYSLRDISNNITLDSERIMVLQDSFKKQYNMSIEKSGEGQIIYLYEVSCKNIRSAFCSTGGVERKKNSIITVDYSLSEDEVLRKSEIEAGISGIYLKKAYSDFIFNSSALRAASIVSALPDSSLESAELIKKSEKLKSHSLDAAQQFSDIQYLFRLDEYVLAHSIFTNELPLKVSLFSESAESFSNYSMQVESGYNATAGNILLLSNINSESLPEIYNYSIRAGNSELASEAEIVSQRIVALYWDFSSRNYQSIFSERAYSEYLLNRTNALLENYSRSITEAFLTSSFESRYAYLVSLGFGYNGSSAKILPLFANQSANLSLLSESCAVMNSISDFKDAHNSNAPKALSLSGFENSTEFLSAMKSFSGNSVYGAEQIVKSELDAVKSLRHYEFLKAISYSGLSNSSNISLPSGAGMDELIESASVEFPPGFDSALASSCGFGKNPYPDVSLLKIENFTLDKISHAQYNFTSGENFSIRQGTPKCCFNGICAECCTADSCASKNYPVIFIHGHLSYNRNSPEQVINSFAGMQDALEEAGYIPAGLIDLEETSPYGDWGRNPKPVSVRASYYYISYYDLGIQTLEARKSDSIENYAIRLREIVEEVKRRTGSPKVIIVAHSMGGLVAREYMLLFGEESVDKMVTIGTPNKGIEGALIKLCPVFGSQKECEDMVKDSVFLKRLNNPNNNPGKARVYTISAVGCSTYGKPGDGVIAADNVVLDFARNYRIEGRCTDLMQSDLHGRMLQPEIYPQTLKILKEIIADNSTGPFSPELIKR